MIFDNVYIAKPKCSRNSSIEAFMVGIGFKGKEVLNLKESNRLNLWDALTTLNHLHNFDTVYSGKEEELIERNFAEPGKDQIVEFVACGKREKLDADMNYSLN